MLGSQADPNTGNNSAAANTTVTPVADLSVTKTDSPDTVTVRSNLTYPVTVTNTGPSTSTGVVLTDTLPGGVLYVSATPSQGSCPSPAGLVVTCSLGNLSPGTSVTVLIVVTPTTIGTITNTASVTGSELDPNTSNNSATAVTLVTSIVQTRLPTSVRNVANAWTLVGCGEGGGGNGNAYQCVDDPIGSPNNGIDYIRVQNSGKEAIFGFSAFSVPSGATINYVRVTYVAIANGGSANIKAALRVRSNVYSQPTAQVLSSTWGAQYSYDWMLNPRTGARWTVAEVNGQALEGMGVYSGSGDESVTQVYVTVGYQ